jgi:hypothetical protein
VRLFKNINLIAIYVKRVMIFSKDILLAKRIKRKSIIIVLNFITKYYKINKSSIFDEKVENCIQNSKKKIQLDEKNKK